MAVNAPSTAADLQTVEKEVLDILLNGKDGVEAGFTTSEFWLSLIALGLDYFAPGVQVDPNLKLAAAVVIVATFTGFRTWRKNGGPARLVASLSAFRKAVFG